MLGVLLCSVLSLPFRTSPRGRPALCTRLRVFVGSGSRKAQFWAGDRYFHSPCLAFATPMCVVLSWPELIIIVMS